VVRSVLINISPANAKWFVDNFGAGDPIVVKNSSDGRSRAQRSIKKAELNELTSTITPFRSVSTPC
jgi:hypothetical protein